MSELHTGNELTPASTDLKNLDEQKLMAIVIAGYNILNADVPMDVVKNYTVLTLGLLACELKDRGVEKFYCDGKAMHRAH